MKITFLGTGTSTGVPEIGCTCQVCQSNNPKDKRLRTSALIETKGKSILIDCGPDFRYQMLRDGHTSLDAVLVTHEHYDHVGGLDDLRPFSHEKEVDIYAEDYVTDAIISRIPYCFRKNKYKGIPNLNLHAVREPFMASGIEVVPIRVVHGSLPIFGYRIDSLAYITDMKTIADKEIEKLESLDVLVVNALRIDEKHPSHQGLYHALEFIEQIAPKKAYLTHMSHKIGLHDEIEKLLPDYVHLAYDGLSYQTAD